MRMPVVSKMFRIPTGYEITNDQLPNKFQPHCPPTFKAFTAHTVDMDKATLEDPFVRNNIIYSGEKYKFNVSVALIESTL